MRNNALETEGSAASIRTNDIILRRRHNSFYKDVDEIIGKPNHYTIMKGDFSAQVKKRSNPIEVATGTFGLEMRNERGDIMVEWVTTRRYKIMNTIFQREAWRRWTWKSTNGVTRPKSTKQQTGQT